MKKKKTALQPDHFDVATGLAGAVYSKKAFPVDRHIQVNEDHGDGQTGNPAFYEFRVNVDGIPLYLRSNEAPPGRLIDVHSLAIPAQGKKPARTLMSIDDLQDVKSAIRNNRAEIAAMDADDRSFFRRNRWWLLFLGLAIARMVFYLKDIFQLDRVGFDDVYPYLLMPLLILYGWFSKRLIGHLFGGAETPKRRQAGGGRPFGQHIRKPEHFHNPAIHPLSKTQSRIFGLKAAEGKVRKLQYQLCVREVDGTDISAVACFFEVVSTTGRVVKCSLEVSKREPLFFMQEGDVVRVAGKRVNQELRVEYGLNLNDKHTYTRHSLLDMAPRLRNRKSFLAFLMHAIYESTYVLVAGGGMFILFMAAALAVGVVPTGVFLDLVAGPKMWEVSDVDLWLPGQIGVAIIACVWLFIVYRCVKRALLLWTAAKLLGLASLKDLFGGYRFVCNEDNVPFDAISFNVRSTCLNAEKG